MCIAPEKLQTVVSHGHVVNGPQVRRYLVGVQAGIAAHLIDAAGALAPEPKKPVGKGTPMSVIPEDDYGITVEGYFLGKNGSLHVAFSGQ